MSGKYNRPLGELITQIIRNMWKCLPKVLRYRISGWIPARFQTAYARFLISPPARKGVITSHAPLVVAGLFSSASGIGEAARATYRALKAAGLEPIAVDLSQAFGAVDGVTEIDCQPMPDAIQGILILQLNGPETISALQYLQMDSRRHWYRIGYWAWELLNFPKGWDRSFRYLSEIWTVSTFSAEALRKSQNAPEICVFGHAISPPASLSPCRQRFGLDPDAFVFLTMADSNSSFERKNPFAAINAFRDAFGTDPQKQLIVKTRNLDACEAARCALEESISDSPNIQLIEQNFTDAEKWDLLITVDAVLSLHRSEGFGLVLAEAMALGKPVICTGWSGNKDFTNRKTAALVRARMIPCIDPYGIYQDRQAHWAEIDHVHAVHQIRNIAARNDYRSKLGHAGQTIITQEFSHLSIGQKMSERLQVIVQS